MARTLVTRAPGPHFALGKLRRGMFPCWKSRNSDEYCFAAPWKHSPHWLVIRGGEWGTLSDPEFTSTYKISNSESRKTFEKIAQRRPELVEMMRHG